MTAFHFVNPGALALLIVAPLLSAAYRYGDRRRAAAIAAWGRSPAAAPDARLRGAKRAMQLAACSALAIALARPALQSAAPAPLPATGDLVFLLDVSRSMLATDVAPGRLYRAREVIRAIAAQARGQRLALVAFAGTQAVQCPLTLDSAFFEEMVNVTGPDSVTRGGTRLGDALLFAAAHAFDDAERDSKTLVVVSDGEDHDSAPAARAREAARSGVRIVTLGIGDPVGGALVPDIVFQGRPVVTRLEEGTLRATGEYVPAGTGQFDAAAVYRRLLAPVHRPRGKSPESGDRLWMACLTVAILLLALELRIPERRLAQAALLACLALATPFQGLAQTVDEWFSKGVQALDGNRYQDAIRYFAGAATWSPGVSEIRFNLAKALYGLKSYSEAAGNFEMAARSARDAQLKAKCKLGQGNALFRDAEQVYGRQAVTYYMAAVDAYREAQRLDPELFDAEFNRKVAERRLQHPPADRLPPGATPPPPGEPGADADRVLKSMASHRPTVARKQESGVERDW